MLLSNLFLLLFYNGLISLSESSILFSRAGITILFCSIIISYDSYFLIYLEKGIILFGGLFKLTSIIQSFQIFILVISIFILSLISFYSRKSDEYKIFELNSYYETIAKPVFQSISRKGEYINLINKNLEQFTIIEFCLIIVFCVSGACLLISSADLGSIYLCIELQSFSLYIISSLHRNSESATGSALTYFLLGGLSSCYNLCKFRSN
jgi:NADH-ubiquinone oxidoreductase chain 2